MKHIMKYCSLAVLALSVTISSGCSYTTDRVRDFSDLLHVTGGVGGGVSMRATNYVQAGLLFQGPRAQGSLLTFLTGNLGQNQGLGRGILPIVEPAAELGLAPIYYFRSARVGENYTDRSVLLAKTLIQQSEDVEVLQRWYDNRFWQLYPGPRRYAEGYDRRFWDLGASIYLGVGFEFTLNLIEVADFFLGFAMIDIAEDDWSKQDGMVADDEDEN